MTGMCSQEFLINMSKSALTRASPSRQVLKLVTLFLLGFTWVAVSGDQSLTDRGTGTTQWIDYSNGKLSLDVRNIGLGYLLEEVSRQSGLNVTGYAGLEMKVSTRFSRLPMRQALSRILKNQDYILEARHTEARSSNPAGTRWRLLILPSGNQVPARWQLNGADDTALPKNGDRLRADEISDLAGSADSTALGELTLAISDFDSG
jgi:hypothetical protein